MKTKLKKKNIEGKVSLDYKEIIDFTIKNWIANKST
jgi:hypothetical protein